MLSKWRRLSPEAHPFATGGFVGGTKMGGFRGPFPDGMLPHVKPSPQP